MSKSKSKIMEQQKFYDYFMSCAPEELLSWYMSYVNGYPTHVVSMIKVIVNLRQIDTSNWPKFYR